METTFAEYRKLFPHLRSGKLWLNHAAISPLNSRTKQAMTDYLTGRSEGIIDDFPQIVQISDAAKQQLGTMIGAPAKRIGFVHNTSDGLNILANGLDWQSGDRIVLNDIEFPANVVPFLNLRRLGVEIDFVRSRNGEVHLEDLERAITPRTRLLSISFVQFFSGFKADLEAIGDLCRRNNILFCVDAIQGLGSAPIDVHRAKIDFLSTSSHKWLLGMMGLGFVFVTEELQQRIQQSNAGWTSNRNYFSRLFDYRLDFDESARRYENGAQNHAGIVALGESASLLNEAGISSIHEHLLFLTDEIIRFAQENDFPLFTPAERTKRAGIVTFAVPNAESVFEELNRRQIIVSLREGKLRLSPHFYNTIDDVRRACDTIRSIVRPPVNA